MSKPQLTTRHYQRNHGNAPRGTGLWAFQRSTYRDALATDLYGEIESHTGTLLEATRKAQASMVDASHIAVLP